MVFNVGLALLPKCMSLIGFSLLLFIICSLFTGVIAVHLSSVIIEVAHCVSPENRFYCERDDPALTR